MPQTLLDRYWFLMPVSTGYPMTYSRELDLFHGQTVAGLHLTIGYAQMKAFCRVLCTRAERNGITIDTQQIASMLRNSDLLLTLNPPGLIIQQ